MNFDGVANPPYNFKTRSSDVGTKIYAYGYPMALSIMGKEIKVTDGMISSKTGFDGDITTYQITAPIQAGNSGGPLFDEKGNLINAKNGKAISKDQNFEILMVCYQAALSARVKAVFSQALTLRHFSPQ